MTSESYSQDVMSLARSNSEQLRALVHAATHSEDNRERQMQGAPKEQRVQLEKKFNKERQREMGQIQALKHDQALMVASAMRDGIPDRVDVLSQQSSKMTGTTSHGGKSIVQRPGVPLNNETKFLKEMYGKIEPGQAPKSGPGSLIGNHKSSMQKCLNSRLAENRFDKQQRGDRRDLLAQKRGILQRLRSINDEEMRGGYGTSRSQASSFGGYAGNTCRSEISSPRSSIAADFYDSKAPIIARHSRPGFVPNLRRIS